MRAVHSDARGRRSARERLVEPSEAGQAGVVGARRPHHRPRGMERLRRSPRLSDYDTNFMLALAGLLVRRELPAALLRARGMVLGGLRVRVLSARTLVMIMVADILEGTRARGARAPL